MTHLLDLLLVLAVLVAVLVVLGRVLPGPMARYAIALQRALGGLTARTTRIPGFDIAYLEAGSGEPLVLVHGIGADKDNFAQVAPFLRGIGRIISLDLPGFGESGKPLDGDYSVEVQAERLAQFLDALALPRAHFAGNSMGGAIVLGLAHLHPGRVQSLWLLAPAGVGGAAESEMFRRHREQGEFPLFAQTMEQYAGVIDICFTRPPFIPYCVRHELARAAADNYALHTRIFHDLLATPFAIEDVVAGLETPTLLVWGDRDRVLDVSGAEILHRALPRSQVVIMPGIGHIPMIEAARRAAADYRAFRAALPAGVASVRRAG